MWNATTFENQTGIGIDGRRKGPVTKEWLFTKRKIDDRGCWNWTGTVDTKGYGLVSSRSKRKILSRLAYEMFVGEIPEGLCVLHSCDNPKCFNPDHLSTGTHLKNMRDCGRKRRAKHHKFSAEQILEIRASIESCRVIGMKYGCGKSNVSRIRRGITHRWVKSVVEPSPVAC